MTAQNTSMSRRAATLKTAGYYAVLWLFLSLMVTLAGPFGTFDGLSFTLRSSYWATVVGSALSMALILRAALSRLLPVTWSRTVHDGVLLVAFAVIYSPLLHVFSTAFAVHLGQHIRSFPLTVLELTGLVAVTTGGVIVARMVFWRDPVPPLEPTAAGLLSARLPAQVQGTVLTVSGRDHYVDVTTTRGNATILMRFSDALRELDESDGSQVHRSHWVADEHVRTLMRDGTRWVVVLRDGTQVPVSRSFRDQVVDRWGSSAGAQPAPVAIGIGAPRGIPASRESR